VLGGFFAALVVLLFIGNWRCDAHRGYCHSHVDHFDLHAHVGDGFYLEQHDHAGADAVCGHFVIDDAVVVLENIFRFIEEKGIEPMRAAREATADIGLAHVATTMSLVIIFAGGIHGRHRGKVYEQLRLHLGLFHHDFVVGELYSDGFCARFLKAKSDKVGHKKSVKAAGSTLGSTEATWPCWFGQ
jgi:HAE1 family hydrophobic/amphiphilic exporter-1